MVFKKTAAVRFFVPEGLLKIARQFIAGERFPGNLSFFSVIPAMSDLSRGRDVFSRPCGTA